MPGSARSRRREEERQRETGGSQAGPCRRDSPASGSAPRPAPGPKPTLPHPPRTEWERPCRAAPPGWVGGAGDAEPAEPTGGLGERSQGAEDVPPARPRFEASAPRRPSASARPGGVRFGVRGPGGAKQGAARSGAPRWQPGTCTPARTPCAPGAARVRTPSRAGARLRRRGPECSEAARPAGGAAFRAEGLRVVSPTIRVSAQQGACSLGCAPSPCRPQVRGGRRRWLSCCWAPIPEASWAPGPRFTAWAQRLPPVGPSGSSHPPSNL